MRLLASLLLVMSLVANAQEVTVTFEASESFSNNAAIAYTVYKNGEAIITDSSLLIHKLEAKTGDVFYARSVLKGIKSGVSSIAIYGTCGNKTYSVAKNRSYETRPMRDIEFSKTKQRIAVGTKCESEVVKKYSWHFATNKSGFRGLVICGEDK